MFIFNFSEYDVGNSHIVPDHHLLRSFSVTTERTRYTLVQKVTTIRVAVPGSGESIIGLLDWKNQTLEIQGVRKPIAEVQHKPGGALSRTREWRWSGKTYKAKFKKGVWTATCGENAVAVYTPLKRHPFRKDELATLNFVADMSDGDMALVILTLLHFDLMLPPQERPMMTFHFGERSNRGRRSMNELGDYSSPQRGYEQLFYSMNSSCPEGGG